MPRFESYDLIIDSDEFLSECDESEIRYAIDWLVENSYIRIKKHRMSEKFIPFHQHLLVKCWLANPPRDAAVLNEWFVKLVKSVDMIVVAGPTSVYVDTPGNEGLTGTVTLATSHSAIHFWDNISPAMAQFDIYSCKSFTLETVMDNFIPWGLIKYEWIMSDRNDGISMISKGNYENI